MQITHLGDLKPGGRSEVKLLVHNKGERLHLETKAWLEKGGREVSAADETVWLAPGSTRRIYLGYEMQEPGEHLLFVRGRDAETGRLLFLFEGRTPR